MPSGAILKEAQRLHTVSNRLNALAEKHPAVSDALVTISGTVRHTATLLEVLVVTKFGPLPGPGPSDGQRLVRLHNFCYSWGKADSFRSPASIHTVFTRP